MLKSLGSTRLARHVVPFGQSLFMAQRGRSPFALQVAAHAMDVYVVPVWFVVAQHTSFRPQSALVWHSAVTSVRAHVVAHENVY